MLSQNYSRVNLLIRAFVRIHSQLPLEAFLAEFLRRSGIRLFLLILLAWIEVACTIWLACLHLCRSEYVFVFVPDRFLQVVHDPFEDFFLSSTLQLQTEYVRFHS